MSRIFSGGQVVDLAVQIEQRGAAFYEAAKEKTDDENIKGVFDYLIREEKKHLETFKSMLSDLELEKPAEEYEGQWDAYLQTAAGEHIFNDAELADEIIEDIDDEADALEYAIAFEKDSILLFYELSELTPKKHKSAVQQLVREEKEHLQKLSRLKKELSE